MQHGKRYRAAAEKAEKKLYEAKEAMAFVLENAVVKFDESVEVHLRLNIDPKKGDQQIRGTIVLPHGTGKSKKVAVVTTTMQKEANEAGADLVGGEEVIETIKSGKFFEGGYDVLVATPEMMPKLAPMAKILGPKGMMPSPKTETVTVNIASTVAELKKGKVSFKNDNTGNVHQSIGKVSFGPEKLLENYEAFVDVVAKAKPSAVKGKLILSKTVCSTMGVGVRLV